MEAEGKCAVDTCFPTTIVAYLDVFRQCFPAQRFVYFRGYLWALAMLGTTRKCMTNIARTCVFLVMAYYMIQRREPYRDAGADFFDHLQPEHTARRLLKRLESLGCRVTPQSSSSDVMPSS